MVTRAERLDARVGLLGRVLSAGKAQAVQGIPEPAVHQLEDVEPCRGQHSSLRPRQDVTVKLTRKDGSTETFETRCRIDTVNELDYFLNGGILPYVLRKLAAA